MRVGNCRHAIAAYAAIVGLCHCGGVRPAAQPTGAPADTAPSAASSTPQWEAVDTEKDCAKAQAQCGGGVCDAKIKNDCDAPVRCSLDVTVTCSAVGGESIANGSNHATINAHDSSELGAQATCGSGDAVHTAIEKLRCH
jgi:hypothetical protein